MNYRRRLFYLIIMLLVNCLIAQENNPFSTEKIFHGKDQMLGSECVLKSSKLSVDGEKSMKIFEIDVPTSGEYYLSAWVMNTGIIEKNNGLKFFIDEQKSPAGTIKPKKEGWQSSILLTNDNAKSKKITLTAGTHFLTFCTIIPEVPPVEFIKISTKESDAGISEANWSSFFEAAKKNVPSSEEEIFFEESSNLLKVDEVLPNPEGDYDHQIDITFTYTYAANLYFTSGSNVVLETNRSDNPCYSNPVMYLFNSYDPVNNGSWSDDDGGDCYQSRISCQIQQTGYHCVLIRSKYSNQAQTTNLYLNGNLYASNVVVSGATFDCDHSITEEINYFGFTSNVAQGDPKLWIESYDNKILAYNDDYSGSGDFNWQQNPRVKKTFSQRMGKCILTSSSTYYPTGVKSA